jgi:HEAT repeat protein
MAGVSVKMRIRPRRWDALWGPVGIVVCLMGPLGTAQAAEPKPPAGAPKKSVPQRNKKGAPAVTVDVAALTEKLKSSDPADVQAALGQAKAAGKGARPLAPVIEELLRRGPQTEVAGLALQALGEVGAEASAPAIVPYCHHRNPELRKQALAALSRTGGTDAAATVRAALSDPDRGVRGVAASGLGPLKAKDAVVDLFAALDHDIGEAASSLGQLCTPADCDRLTAKLSTLGLDVMTSAFDAILFRPTTDIPEDTKIHVIERVRDLHTEEASKYLRDVQSRWPPAESARVRQALDQAVRQGAKS